MDHWPNHQVCWFLERQISQQGQTNKLHSVAHLQRGLLKPTPSEPLDATPQHNTTAPKLRDLRHLRLS